MNNPYPCFRSFDPDSGFCTMKCEFAGECEPETPASAKGQEDDLENSKGESKMADDVKKLVEELEATPIDDLLEKLASIDEVDTLRQICDHYGIKYDESDDLNGLMIAVDSYFDLRASGQLEETEEEDSGSETEKEEAVPELEEEVKEEPPKKEKSDSVAPESILREQVGTTLANSISDHIISSSDILTFATKDSLETITEAIKSVKEERQTLGIDEPSDLDDLEDNTKAKAELKPSPPKETKLKPSPSDSVSEFDAPAKFSEALIELGLTAKSNRQKTRYRPRITDPFVLLTFQSRSETWNLVLLGAEIDDYPECELFRNKPTIDYSNENANDVLFRHAATVGFSRKESE